MDRPEESVDLSSDTATDLQTAPAGERRPRRLIPPGWLAGPLAAGAAAIIGLAVLVLAMAVLWAVSAFAGLDLVGAMRIAGILWVVTHDVAMRMGAATISLLPWGVTLIWLALLAVTGHWAGRVGRITSFRDAALATAGGGVIYGALLAGVSAAVSVASPLEIHISVVRAFGIGFVLAVIGIGVGILRSSGLVRRIPEHVPTWVRVVARSAAIGILTLVGAGALLAAISLTMNLSQAIGMQDFLDPGLFGGFALLLLGLGFLPVASMWAIAYALGAGVAIGPGVVLSPFLQTPAPTALPPFPLLAALPQQASPIAWALPVVGVLVGIVIGLAVARGSRMPALQRLGVGVAAVACSAIGIAILTRMSFGSLGADRLAGLGPSSQTVALLAAGLMLIGTVPTALAAGRERGASRDEPSSDATPEA